MKYETKILLDELVWGEGPRWHEQKLWFLDIFGKKVMKVDINGKAEIVVDVPTLPSGLGWLPDGRLLIVSGDGRILRQDPSGLSAVADLSKLAVGINDMVVDHKGRAYVGSYGYDVRSYKPGQEVEAWITLVTPEGDVRVVADEMICPNGMVITSDGNMLIAADTFAKQLVAFNIEEDGSLTGRRVWAYMEAGPDGICLDAEGAIWAATPNRGEVIRLREGGEVTHRIKVSTTPLACMLGGRELRTLFIVTVDAHNDLDVDTLSNPEAAQIKRGSRIEIVDVEIPGAGLP
ncbi:SMP-30/gluconolactonase/LRE family protein [Paenibacillus polymyxa]|uniref:SMP-30/gluconolactonase/LRE family protein n=1 Tax=Paenibacillus TaxID=44249 RepID=UPI000F505ADF|nr:MULTISPECIES: SMP-30/gluconolactonase/LRE family protein [Paenibacillus]KAF6655162.1 SMP-30/gluconolactonase/LRE family protein [Paenibacillus sp. EKM301P]RPE03894.1 5-valerolactone hydrolase [Paenibacillus polymyxa]UBS89498.1 SMP-30/gluconolactonase/LRE family protein [Paenibacillus polymyxa]WHX38187.1 SMP-30/gluconolactonase/LRE family protein [Paenibacillus polymyxa]